MSGANAKSDIQNEFADAVKTAGAYLQAMKVLGEDGISAPEYRERDARIMRDAILKGGNKVVHLPNDPFARDAAKLAHQFLHEGHNPKILETLLGKDTCHPAYREALTFVLCRMRATGAEMPEQLQI